MTSPDRENAPGTVPVVRLRAIRKRFGYRDTLRGIDLDVSRGECLGILGDNGAGKSTLLRIMATQWQPSSGSGNIFGHDLRSEPVKIRRRIGVVLHQSLLRPELTLDENLSFTADLYGVSLDSRSDELIDRLGLTAWRRTPVGTFSQGMTKRAGIIRSLLHGPDLWLLDEPFSGLDPRGKSLCVDLVREFVAGGGTAVVVTHQVELGRDLATRMIHMDDGEIRDNAAMAEGASS